MVKIRLRRMGAKKQPYYRLVVQDSRSPRDGKFIEIIGNYNPRTDPPTLEVEAERALYWLGVGAQPSEAVRRMFDKLGLLSQVSAARQGQPVGQTADQAASAVTFPVTLEPDDLPTVEEDEELELDMFEGAEEAEEAEDEWESDMETSDEIDDLDDDDWEAEVDDTDDDTDDEPIEDDE